MEKELSNRPRSAGDVAIRLRQLLNEVAGRDPGSNGSFRSGAHDPGATPECGLSDSSGLENEKRHVTIACFDLRLPEDSEVASLERLGALSVEFESFVREVLEAHSGTVVSSLQQRVVTCFGYPVADENDAARAVSAAREVIRGVSDRERLEGFECCVGIHSGEVLVWNQGAFGSGSRLVAGGALDYAASVCSRANRGEALVSEPTHELIQEAFETEEARRQDHLAGNPRVWKVKAEVGPRQEWMEGRWQELVGREQELGFLLDLWNLAAEGAGQGALITGEAGIGKTGLIRALAQELSERSVTCLGTCANPESCQSPFFPVVDLLYEALQIDRGSSAGNQRLRSSSRSNSAQTRLLPSCRRTTRLQPILSSTASIWAMSDFLFIR